MINKTIDMPPLEINIMIRRSGTNQPRIAEELGVTLQAVNRVVNGHTTSHRTRRHIADVVGVDIKHIWPSTYLYGSGPKGPGRPSLNKGEQKAA